MGPQRIAALSYLMKHQESNSPILKHFYSICIEFSDSFRVLNELFPTCEKALTQLKPPVSDTDPIRDFERLGNYFRAIDIDSRHTPVLRSGLYLALYANVEDLLTRICRLMEKEGGIGDSNNRSILLSDLKGSGIGLAKLFLEKVAGVDMPASFERVFPFLRDVRNALVHRNGIIKLKQSKKMKTTQIMLKNSQVNGRFMDPIMVTSRSLANQLVISVPSEEECRIVLLAQFNSDASAILHFMLNRVIQQLEEKLKKLDEILT